MDQSFLARLSRPTASSASKQVEKGTVAPHVVPHVRPTSLKKRSRKSGGGSGTESGHSEDGDGTLGPEEGHEEVHENGEQVVQEQEHTLEEEAPVPVEVGIEQETF